MARQKLQPLSERSATLLKILVDSYISDGQPVGSKKLAHNAGLDISPATIRNVMCALEKKGLVRAPHTSAGRIPTEQGFRLFVDNLLQVQPLHKRELSKLKQELDPDQSADSLINHATQVVSELTHMAGVISIPKPSQSVLRHIEFLSLPDRRVLAIMVINEKEVQNRVLHIDKEYTASALQSAANFLNQQFAGQDVHDIRHKLLSELQRTRQDVDATMQTAIEVAGKALSDSDEQRQDYRVQGKTNLVRYSDGVDRDHIQQLLEAFDRKREMLGLLDRCIQSECVKIFIGHEVGIEGMEDCSVITAPYAVEGQTLGVLGVIGPTRINYDRIIPVVDVTAKLLGEALNQ